MSNNSNNVNNYNSTQKPINLFFTNSFWSVVGVFYISTLSPFIDKAINESITKKDIGNLINVTLVSIFGASLKSFDSNVYTPKGLPGKNKDDVLNAINNPIINTIQAVQSTQAAIEKPSISTISTALQDINDRVNNAIPIKDVTTISNTVLNPVSNVVGFATNPVSNLLDPINSLFNINNNNTKKELDIPFNNPKTNTVITTKQETFYKLEAIDSSKLEDNKKVKVGPNIYLYIDSYHIDKDTNHISFNIKDRVFYAFIPHVKLVKDNINVDIESSNNFRPTIEQCNTIYDTTLTSNEYKDMINCLNTFNINTKLDVAHFISQTAHESGGLRYSKEIADGEDYEFREDLGNTELGDGPKFKGKQILPL